MAARVYDIYDFSSAFVEPNVTQAPPAPQTATTATAVRSDTNRPPRAFACLLIFAGVLTFAGVLVAVTPLGAIDADVTVPFLAVCAGAVGVSAWVVTR